MTTIPLEWVFYPAAALMCVGLTGVLLRRNVLFVLLSIEVMFNAAALAFVGAGAYWGQADGQVMFIFILAAAAAEIGVALAIILLMQHRFRTLDSRAASEMKG